MLGRRKKRNQLPSPGELEQKSDDDEENYGMKDLRNGFERRRLRKKNSSSPSKRPYVFTLHLLKSKNELGLEIAGGKGSKYGDVGIYVTNVINGSNAAKDGRIHKGDEILSINRRELFDLSIKQVRDLLLSAAHIVQLKVASKYPLVKDGCSTDSLNKIQQELDKSPSFVFELLLKKDSSGRGLGFSLMDGSDVGKNGIFVKNIFASGVAAEDGTLKKGDQILRVNDEDISYESFDSAMTLVKNLPLGLIKFKIRRRIQTNKSSRNDSVSSVESQPLTRTRSGEFLRFGSDRSIHRGQPLYSRSRKPHYLLRNTPINETRFQPIIPQIPMTSSLTRLQRHQSTESTDSCSSVESSSRRTNSPIPRMGVSAKRRNRERREEMALQRRSQSLTDLTMVPYSSARQNGRSADTLDGPESMPYYGNYNRLPDSPLTRNQNWDFEKQESEETLDKKSAEKDEEVFTEITDYDRQFPRPDYDDYEEPVSYQCQTQNGKFVAPVSTRLNKHRRDFNLPGSTSSIEKCDVTPEVGIPRLPVTNSVKYEYV